MSVCNHNDTKHRVLKVWDLHHFRLFSHIRLINTVRNSLKLFTPNKEHWNIHKIVANHCMYRTLLQRSICVKRAPHFAQGYRESGSSPSISTFPMHLTKDNNKNDMDSTPTLTEFLSYHRAILRIRSRLGSQLPLMRIRWLQCVSS